MQTAAEVDWLSGLRSAKNRNWIWRTRFLCYCGPAAWNTLPSDLHDITVTPVHSENDSRVYFMIVLTYH